MKCLNKANKLKQFIFFINFVINIPKHVSVIYIFSQNMQSIISVSNDTRLCSIPCQALACVNFHTFICDRCIKMYNYIKHVLA